MTITDSNATATIVAGVVGAAATVVTAVFGPSISRKMKKTDTVQVVNYYQSVIDRLNRKISQDQRLITYYRNRNEKAIAKQQRLQEIIDHLEERKMKAERHRAALIKKAPDLPAAPHTEPQSTNTPTSSPLQDR